MVTLRAVWILVGMVMVYLSAFRVEALESSPLLPEADGLIHLGVASCASSVCHGKTTQQDTTAVLQNEYTTWTQHDRHARAYKTLLSDDSKNMAALLGIGPAHEAKVCLDCHTDNVTDGLRGRRFQRSDGVGCEACHGGAEKWIKTHTEPNATHGSNIASGLYPADVPEHRANLCMSCHLGTENKMATHDIMGAGHPRLSFELDTFSIIQPQHYAVDDDYLDRKRGYSGLNVWLTGQLLAADHWLSLIQSPKFKGDGLFPEISFYDCHACHHGMSDERNQSGLVGKPGDLRINDAYLQTMEAIITVIASDQKGQWRVEAEAFLKAGHRDKEELISASERLRVVLVAMLPKVRDGVSNAQQKQLLSELTLLGSQRRMLDYSSSEQVVMGISVIVDSLKLNDRLGTQVDRLYDALGREDSFKPQTYQNALREFRAKVKALSL